MEAMSEPFSGWTATYFFENSTFWVKKAARQFAGRATRIWGCQQLLFE
jgi:hypothetical protein